MYTERPHLRYGGVYVSRNTYIRVGIMNLDCRNPVHLVVYYRYFRFFEDGTVLTRTSPDPVSLVWKSLRTMPAVVSKQDTRLPGRWRLKARVHHCSCIRCPAVLLLSVLLFHQMPTVFQLRLQLALACGLAAGSGVARSGLTRSGVNCSAFAPELLELSH